MLGLRAQDGLEGDLVSDRFSVREIWAAVKSSAVK